MKREEVERLAKLARIGLKEGEAEELAEEISGIVDYVSAINALTASTAMEKKVGALSNVMRQDGEPRAADTYTEALLNAAPERVGRYVKVKKILGEK